jgi:hypothetical protein
LNFGNTVKKEENELVEEVAAGGGIEFGATEVVEVDAGVNPLGLAGSEEFFVVVVVALLFAVVSCVCSCWVYGLATVGCSRGSCLDPAVSGEDDPGAEYGSAMMDALLILIDSLGYCCS